jgi:hypothetical protein
MRLQNMYRARNARRVAFAKRVERNAGINIQRVFRGHQGRRRANAERDKYLFSKSQTQVCTRLKGGERGGGGRGGGGTET